jgi:hypothetical protein
MSYIGIGSPIPDISSLPGQTGGEVEVTLDYPSAAVCNDGGILTPTFDPAGGVFAATPSGLNIDSSSGVVTPTGSTPQDYTISYTVSGVVSSFDLTINAVQQSTFSYASSSFEDSGTALPTLAGGTTSGGTFVSSSPSDLTVNASTGELTLAGATVGGPYTITYTTPGPCATSSTFQISITATVRIIANNFALDFNGTDEYVSNPISYPLVPSFSSDDITISAWVNPSSWTFPNNYQYIFQDGASTNNRFVNLRLQNYAGINGVYFEVRNGSSGGSPSNCNVSKIGALNTGSWYHIVATYSPTNGAKIYVNNSTPTGGEVDSTPIQNGLDRSSHTAFALGAYVLSGSATSSYFNGSMDEVAVWNKELSANAVQEIYNATINNPGYAADLFKLANESQAPVYWNRMGDD